MKFVGTRNSDRTSLYWKITCAIFGLTSVVAVYVSTIACQRADRTETALRQTEENFEAVWCELADVHHALLCSEVASEGHGDFRKGIFRRAIVFHEQFIDRNESNCAMRWGTARAYRQLAGLYGMVGDPKRAKSACRRAIALLDALIIENPNEPRFRCEAAEVWYGLGVLLSELHDTQESIASYERSMSILCDLLDVGHISREYLQMYVRAYDAWGELTSGFAFRESVEGHHRAAIKMFEQWAEVSADSTRPRFCLGLAHLNYAIVLSQEERHAEAKSALASATSLIGTPTTDSAQSEVELWARAKLEGFQMCYLESVGDSDESKLARQRFEEIVEAIRTQSASRLAFARFLFDLSNILKHAGGLEDAERLLRECLAATDDASSLFSSPADYRSKRAWIVHSLAMILRERGELDNAENLLIDAIKDQEAASATGCPDYSSLLADHWTELGLTYCRSGAYTSATEAIEQSVRIRPTDDARNWLVLAMAKWHQNETDDARRCYTKAMSLIHDLQLTPVSLSRLRAEAEQVLCVEVTPDCALEEEDHAMRLQTKPWFGVPSSGSATAAPCRPSLRLVDITCGLRCWSRRGWPFV